MPSKLEVMKLTIINAAYDAAYASNQVYDVLREYEYELAQKSRLADLYLRAEGVTVLSDDIVCLQNDLNATRSIFASLCSAAGVIMSL